MSKLKHIEMLVKALKPTDFGGLVNSLKFVEATDGACSATIKVTDNDTNNMGGMHGGYSATIIDIVSSAAQLIHQNNANKETVSVNLNVSYIKSAKPGDELIVSSRTLRSGKSLVFLEAEIRNKQTNDLLVKGEHTKYIL